MSRSTRALVVCLVLVSGFAAVAVADSWTPYEFKGPAYYKYRITQHGSETQEVVYALDVQQSEQPGKLQVTTTTQSLVDEDDLTGGVVFGASPLLSVAPMLMLGNPMFSGLISQMELVVGTKKDFFGAGYAEVVAKQTVAGVEGFRCELHMKDGETMVKQAEITVHPDLALPLRSVVYDDGEPTFEMTLLEYRKH